MRPHRIVYRIEGDTVGVHLPIATVIIIACNVLVWMLVQGRGTTPCFTNPAKPEASPALVGEGPLRAGLLLDTGVDLRSA